MTNPFVLVIDDNEFVRMSVRDILHLLDIPALLAHSGQSGVDLYADRQEDIRLIFLDLTMPEMDGVETLKALRQINPDVPVIILSAHDPRERERILNGEYIDGVLSKPFDVDEMLAVVEAHRPT